MHKPSRHTKTILFASCFNCFTKLNVSKIWRCWLTKSYNKSISGNKTKWYSILLPCLVTKTNGIEYRFYPAVNVYRVFEYLHNILFIAVAIVPVFVWTFHCFFLKHFLRCWSYVQFYWWSMVSSVQVCIQSCIVKSFQSFFFFWGDVSKNNIVELV